jgi:hypothetical protein
MICLIKRQTKEKGSIENAKKLLKLYPKYTKNTLDNLVIGVETWVYHFEPKIIDSNRIWALENAKGLHILLKDYEP